MAKEVQKATQEPDDSLASAVHNHLWKIFVALNMNKKVSGLVTFVINEEVIIVNSDNFANTNDEKEKDEYNSTGNPKNYCKNTQIIKGQSQYLVLFQVKND